MPLDTCVCAFRFIWHKSVNGLFYEFLLVSNAMELQKLKGWLFSVRRSRINNNMDYGECRLNDILTSAQNKSISVWIYIIELNVFMIFAMKIYPFVPFWKKKKFLRLFSKIWVIGLVWLSFIQSQFVWVSAHCRFRIDRCSWYVTQFNNLFWLLRFFE